MTGSTVFAQSSNIFDNYTAPPMENDQDDPTSTSQPAWPVEDLTNEVQDLLLRDSMNAWLPWMPDQANDLLATMPKDNFEQLDPELLAQSLQLLGQDFHFDLDEATAAALAPTDATGITNTNFLYDEITFDSVPSEDPSLIHSPSEVSTISGHVLLPSATGTSSSTSSMEQDDMDISDDAIRIPCHDASSDEDDDEEDDDEEDDDGDEDDDDDDDEQAYTTDPLTSSYMYHPKRQLEEALLSKITQQMHPDKLPGILSIVSATADHHGHGHEEEVELDLSSLDREQLVRIMLYVDACVREQQGGPAVVLSRFIPANAATNNKPLHRHASVHAIGDDDDDNDAAHSAMLLDGQVDKDRRRMRRRKQQQKRKQKSKFTESGGHHVSTEDATITNLLPTSSMPTVTPKKTRSRKSATANADNKKRTRAPRGKAAQDKKGGAAAKTKKRNGLHKRRLLEDTLLLASDDNDDDEATENNVLIVYSDEKMDFGVVDNQTIVHQPSAASSPVAEYLAAPHQPHHHSMDMDEDDEEIDIM
ncbi:hypothetical protein BC940DRAFT_328675 [Gongronella butleri]|nr:hypothetical protein BC940DRAFT_328675 [Gongronella butleri]